MAITATTLSGAITSTQTGFGVASASGITAPNNQTGAGITILQIDQEFILVTAAPVGTALSNLVRGYLGTAAAAHVSGALVLIGTPADFQALQEAYTGAPMMASQVTGAAYNQPGINLTG